MRKYTQKELKNLVATGAAANLTNYSFEALRDFLHSHNIEKIGYSSGVYGLNGGLLQDRDNGEMYAITARNTALSMAF